MWLALIAVVTAAALALRRTRWAALSLRISRWTYALCLPLMLLYFPMKSGFRFTPLACEWTFGPALAVHSFRNVPHIIMLAIFFALTYAQFRGMRGAFLWSAALSLLMGFLVEIFQGVTGEGHCRMRDLIPDSAGVLISAALIAAVTKLRKPVVLLGLLALTALGCSEADRPANFAAVGPGLYRGGQPSAAQIEAMRRDLDVRTIIRLNRRRAAEVRGIRVIEIPIDPKRIGTDDPATRQAVERAYAAFVDPANAPVYIHCDHGRDRAGFVVALYRARKQRWSYSQIRAELAEHGHGAIMQRYLPAITRDLAREVASLERRPQ